VEAERRRGLNRIETSVASGGRTAPLPEAHGRARLGRAREVSEIPAARTPYPPSMARPAVLQDFECVVETVAVGFRRLSVPPRKGDHHPAPYGTAKFGTLVRARPGREGPAARAACEHGRSNRDGSQPGEQHQPAHPDRSHRAELLLRRPVRSPAAAVGLRWRRRFSAWRLLRVAGRIAVVEGVGIGIVRLRPDHHAAIVDRDAFRRSCEEASGGRGRPCVS